MLKTGQENEIEQVLLTMSFDMDWDKRSSNNRYDSLSSHVSQSGVFQEILLLGL